MALLSHMPLLALMKNINRLASLDLLEPSSNCVQTVIEKLSNEQHLHDAKYVALIMVVKDNDCCFVSLFANQR